MQMCYKKLIKWACLSGVAAVIQGDIHTHSETLTYRHKLSAGADKLSEAEQEVLFSWENLGQLQRHDRQKQQW